MEGGRTGDRSKSAPSTRGGAWLHSAWASSGSEPSSCASRACSLATSARRSASTALMPPPAVLPPPLLASAQEGCCCAASLPLLLPPPSAYAPALCCEAPPSWPASLPAAGRRRWVCAATAYAGRVTQPVHAILRPAARRPIHQGRDQILQVCASLKKQELAPNCVRVCGCRGGGGRRARSRGRSAGVGACPPGRRGGARHGTAQSTQAGLAALHTLDWSPRACAPATQRRRWTRRQRQRGR